MTTLVHLDFETFSCAELKKVGAYHYADHPSTEVLCLCYGTTEKDIELWHPLLSTPNRLFAYAKDPNVLFAGWNSGSFERRIWNLVCARLYGWPKLPKEKWYDIQSDALACAFPAMLKDAAIALGCRNLKDPAGDRLIKKLCCPVKPTIKHPETRWTKEQTPDDFRALYDYCRKDVLAEMEIFHKLPEHPTLHRGQERDIWLHTQDINDRGLPIDLDSVYKVLKHIDTVQERSSHRLIQLTSGRVTAVAQRERIRQELLQWGVAMPDMQGQTLVETLEIGFRSVVDVGITETMSSKHLPPEARELLEIYQACTHTSTAKYKALLAMVCRDGRVRDNLVYHKASTGRYAGAGFQAQNLPRDSWSDPEMALDALHSLSFDEIEFIYGPFVEFAKKLIRSMIKAEVGHVLTDDDLSQIEMKMGFWIADERGMLEGFRKGLDVYKNLAVGMYRTVRYEDITKKQRQSGKIAGLSGIFGGGWSALHKMAQAYGIEMTEEEAKQTVADFRAALPRLVASWREFGSAALRAVQHPGEIVLVRSNTRFRFQMHGRHLALHLPNRRKLWFPFAEVQLVETPWGEMREAVTAMWVDNYTRKWSRRAIIGSNFFQSAVQGLSRDVLMEAQLRLDPVFPIILSVHDEAISHHRIDPALSVQAFQKLFSQVPEWCKDLPIGSDPWQGERYKK